MTNGHRKVIKRIQNRRRFKDRNVASGKCPISFQELQQPHKTICHQEPVRDLTESASQKFNFSRRDLSSPTTSFRQVGGSWLREGNDTGVDGRGRQDD
ncbi:hypothetical protein CEXT_336431 [Caerostris extrusa]|uniref:Uncharacterized protein n=1 Tax=Caerostris extrusa TaxID=172846 RepID=A0AAV4NKG5_CAEEX|nr:hypothetical protein CEXT_336431 [Caerostris extrusa]